ncbi:hypothetical protein [Sphingomonas sp.]|uniref:hypothetical protein n=1 Tax=Sphingomonas sp. TaxID=28214 RepID=UPI002E0D1B24|nr:hypothetical protein [Sphingomonas sp.]
MTHKSGAATGVGMAGWIRNARGARSILVVLFALVLAIRVAIPTGFMPTQAPNGIVISVCTGMGAAKAFLPIEKPGDQDRHSDAESPCTFAAGLGGGLLAPATGDPMPAIAPAYAGVASRAPAHRTVHRLAAPPPPSQGPPARA